MRGKDKDASALAPAAICRKPLRGSFMTLPDELECLRKWRWHLQTKYRRIARPPKTESLPLISGNVGMFRGQLCDKDTLIPFSQGGVQCRPLATSRKCRHCSFMSGIGGLEARVRSDRPLARRLRKARFSDRRSSS